jgi:hypothetical protein
MVRFYFSDKGVTRKMGCPNLWPVHDRQFNRVPRSLFETPGLVVHIEPKICQSGPMARITVFDTARVQFKPVWADHSQERLFGGCVMSAEYYNSGHTTIRSNILDHASTSRTPEDFEHDWQVREACIPVIRQAIELHLTYFPKLIL